MEANLTVNDWSQLKIRKISNTNRTRAIFGDVFLYIPFGNNIEVAVEAYKKQGGEYRLMPYRVPRQPFCDCLIKDELFYPEVSKHSDFPADLKNNCPLPPVNFFKYMKCL